MMRRKEGYYWVKFEGKPEIGYWMPDEDGDPEFSRWQFKDDFEVWGKGAIELEVLSDRLQPPDTGRR